VSGSRHAVGLAAWFVVVVLGAGALVVALVGPSGRLDHAGGDWLADAGAVAVTTAYAWGLAARTGGRPVVFALLTLLLGAVVIATDLDVVRSGAAVLTAVLSAVLAVMVTVPAPRVAGTVRETLVAVAVSAVGALATLAWAPAVDLRRFEYTVLGLSLAACVVTVHRLGAGLHGLGSRGLVTVVGGSVMLGLTVGYAALLQRYGTHALVEHVDDMVRWSHHHLGAFPRPIIALLGVPALTWGTHMRARRRQGWWVCAFGIGVSAPVAYCLVDPGRSVKEVALATAYGAVIGLVLGLLLIRVDLWLTAPSSRRGRRLAETDDDRAPVRPEPGRTHALW
jgi:hypothetical protein